VKIALVHDWLNQKGGAERVLEQLVALYPDAPVFTSMYFGDRMPESYRSWDIRTTFMQRLPAIASHHQMYMPLYPLAFRNTRLDQYDLVISNKSGFCHGVRTGPRTKHICYCLTPTRFLWMYDSYRSRENIGGLVDFAVRRLLSVLRRWDYAAAQEVDDFLAISSAVRERISCFYNRDSTILYPPVDTERYVPADLPPEDYYLIVSRLVPYKRIDLAVRAFSQLGLPLVIIGDGRDRRRLEEIAEPNVVFRGWLPLGPEVVELFQRCRAFVFPGVEDFGIAPVEAQAAGRPVIAFAAGGSLDTVVEGETGLFFRELTAEALARTVSGFDTLQFDPQACRSNALRFSEQHFQQQFRAFVSQIAESE
jgi:glycosyltransferase involved in cell wall biosynthesis